MINYQLKIINLIIYRFNKINYQLNSVAVLYVLFDLGIEKSYSDKLRIFTLVPGVL